MNRLGFPIKGENGWPNLHIDSMKVAANALTVQGHYRGSEVLSFCSYSTPERPYNCTFRADGSFLVELAARGMKAQLTNPLAINELTQALLVRFMRDNPLNA